MARLELTKERLAKIVETWGMNELSLAEWEESFARELQSHGYLPDGIVTADPRTGDRVVFNAARAQRPHDNRTAPGETAPPCIVCTARLTRVVDVADLSNGFTFINKNLYPVVFPRGMDATPADPAAEGWGTTGAASYGLHLLQWTSSDHDLDWHNMPSVDRVIVVERLAALERKLLEESVGRYPLATTWGGSSSHAGFVQIIKNSGAPVGGSVAHGHQQIILTNVMPRKTRDDLRFEKTHGESFARFILRETPRDLMLRDYGEGVLLVPYFMRRPNDMLFVLGDASKRYLHELTQGEMETLADGLGDGILLMRRGLESLGRHVAYNMVFHVGAGAGIYVEFLPYSQEVGGYEQSGYWSCQANPATTAGLLRSLLTGE